MLCVHEMGGDCSRPVSHPQSGGANRKLAQANLTSGRSSDQRQVDADHLGGGTSGPGGGGGFVEAAMKVADVVMLVVEGIDLAMGVLVLTVSSVLMVGSVWLVVAQAVAVGMKVVATVSGVIRTE